MLQGEKPFQAIPKEGIAAAKPIGIQKHDIVAIYLNELKNRTEYKQKCNKVFGDRELRIIYRALIQLIQDSHDMKNDQNQVLWETLTTQESDKIVIKEYSQIGENEEDAKTLLINLWTDKSMEGLFGVLKITDTMEFQQNDLYKVCDFNAKLEEELGDNKELGEINELLMVDDNSIYQLSLTERQTINMPEWIQPEEKHQFMTIINIAPSHIYMDLEALGITSLESSNEARWSSEHYDIKLTTLETDGDKHLIWKLIYKEKYQQELDESLSGYRRLFSSKKFMNWMTDCKYDVHVGSGVWKIIMDFKFMAKHQKKMAQALNKNKIEMRNYISDEYLCYYDIVNVTEDEDDDLYKIEEQENADNEDIDMVFCDDLDTINGGNTDNEDDDIHMVDKEEKKDDDRNKNKPKSTTRTIHKKPAQKRKTTTTTTTKESKKKQQSKQSKKKNNHQKKSLQKTKKKSKIKTKAATTNKDKKKNNEKSSPKTKSSKTQPNSDDYDDLALLECKKLLKVIKRKSFSKSFRKKDGYVALNIKEHMNLSIIEGRLNDDEYNSMYEVAEDVRTIYQHVFTFKNSTTKVYKNANLLTKEFETGFVKILNEFEQDDDTKTMANITSKIIQMDDAIPFRMPVNEQVCGINDYYLTIPFPMDLGTIMNKIDMLNRKNYIRDILLVFDNCCRYNPKEHFLHQIAVKLRKITIKQLKRYFPNV